MRKILLALSLLTAVSAYALTVDEMLARFNKVKQKSKNRHGLVMESYLNVHSELAPSRSGSYEATDFGRTLTLEVHADGTVTGRGAEDGRTFELRDGRVDESHLTATKRFADGTTEPLEGIFINRRRIEGRTAREITPIRPRSALVSRASTSRLAARPSTGSSTSESDRGWSPRARPIENDYVTHESLN